jgi:hypothetical protein
MVWTQGSESESKVVMEDVEANDTASTGSDSGRLIRKANNATNMEDEHLVYDWMRFRRDKVWRCYNLYYSGRKVIVEQGATVLVFDDRALRVRAVLSAQGWTNMVEDHRPVMEKIVWEFYANLYQRRGNSFQTWVRGKEIVVTPTLINTIT